MARKLIRDLFVRLGVVADTTEAKDFDRAVSGAKKSMQAASKIALVFAGSLAALGGGLVASVLQLTEVGDSIDKASGRATTAAGAFQELSVAARFYGQNAEVVEKALIKLNRSMFDAENGAKAQQEAFRRVKVDPRKYDEASDAIMGIADGIQGLSDTDQLSLTQILLGEEGARLLPLLQQGSSEISRLREEARRTGSVLSDEAVLAAAEFSDTMMTMKDAIRAVVFDVGAAFLPALNEAATQVREAMIMIRPMVHGFLDLIDATIGFKVVLLGLAGVIAALLGVAGLFGLLSMVAGLAGSLAALGATVASVMSILGPVAVAVMTVGAAIQTSLLVLAPPLAAMFAVTVGWLVGVVLGLQDLYVWLQGGDSVFGSFLKRMREAHPEATEFFDAIAEGVRFGWELVQLLAEAGRLLGEALWASAIAGVRGVADEAQQLLDILGYVVGFSFQPLFDTLDSLGGRFKSVSDLFNKAGLQVRGVREGLGRLTIPGDAFVGSGRSSTTNNTTNNSVNASIEVRNENPVDAGYQVLGGLESLFFGQAGLTGAS